MNTSEWLADIGKAADELGYGIARLEPGEIVLEPIRGQSRMTVMIHGIFLSGDTLREILRPVPERKPKP